MQTLEANHRQCGRSMPNLENCRLLSKNVFWTNPPVGGAVTGPCDKKRSEVVLLHLGSVRAKFGCNRTDSAGDLLSTDTHR